VDSSRLLARVDSIAAPGGDAVSGHVLRAAMRAGEAAAVRTITHGLEAALAYLWLVLVFSQFPYSQPWAASLGGFLWTLAGQIGRAVVDAAPDLVTVAAILLLARLAVRIVSGLLGQLEASGVSWLEAETAKATQRLAVILIWAFALTAAYPHIPGSSSDAFKGISVLLGLMVSLGSAGIANQVMSSLVAHSRLCRPLDYWLLLGNSCHRRRYSAIAAGE
jgi:hypothetical protein